MSDKSKARSKPAAKGSRNVAFRVSGDYATWLEETAGRNRTTVAGLLDQALAALAEAKGWPAPPPRV